LQQISNALHLQFFEHSVSAFIFDHFELRGQAERFGIGSASGLSNDCTEGAARKT